MNKSYRILLVEDDMVDAELNMREIKKNLPNVTFQRVDNEISYLQMLESFKPDVILSDYNMPVFDGLKALSIAKEKYPLTPFIIVTGSVNEDTAVECMKAGASDYVLKDSLKRLGSAIMGALEQRDLRQQRLESEQKLIKSEQSYIGLFNSISEAILIMNSQCEFIAVNSTAEKMSGFSIPEITGKTYTFLAVQDLNDTNAIFRILTDVFVTGIPRQFDFWSRRKNGMKFPVEVICNKGLYFGDEVIIATARDITERKEAEENLKRERKMLRTLIDNLPATIYVKDAECRKIIANRADLKIVGVESEEEILGKTDLDTFSNEIGARGYADDKVVIETGIPVLNREEDFIDKEGIKRWLLTSKIPLLDENEKITGLVGIGRDITEQKLAQAKILKLSKGIEQSPATVVITDPEGIIEYVNPKFCETTGYSESEAIGKNPRILKSGHVPDHVYRNLWETIGSGKVWSGEFENKRKDGSLFWENATITGIKNEKGDITNYIAIKEDITERKKMQEELINAKERAEESDRLKSAFLANISHEIRTPLNSIIGFSELLNDPDFDQEQKGEFISTIVDNGNSLMNIISDIMDFSMLEAQQMKIRTDVFSAIELLNGLINDFNKKAIKKGIELKINLPNKDRDIKIESDVYRIKQIFKNLIVNSLKFTSKGYIEIGYRFKNNMIEFRVKDTGIGIDPKYHQIIFDRFRQVDTTLARKFGGNGLGLAICKNLAQLLGGQIWVESVPGKYSEFFFTIPLILHKDL